MIRALAILGILMAGQAHAFSPAEECNPEGAERAAGIGEYDVYWHSGGFVLYVTWQEDVRMHLENCKDQRRLVMKLVEGPDLKATLAARDAVFDAVFDALESDEQYTMRQIGRIARAAGAKTSMDLTDYVSCGCELYGGEN
jgi:hypothetical protein